MYDKLVIVAGFQEDKNNGPTGVIKGLIKGFNVNGFTDYELLLYKNDESKSAYIKRMVKKIFGCKNCIINVHTDGYIIPFIVYFLTLLNKKNKYYLTCHGLSKIEKNFDVNINKKNIFLEKILYKHFPNLICVSRMQKDDIFKLYGRKDNVNVIENGTDAWDVYKVTERKKEHLISIINLGGLSERKGLTTTLKLCRSLKDKNISFKMDVFGSKVNESQQKYFEEMVNKLDLQNEVHYVKYISNKDELYETIQNYKIMLCLSEYDTFNVAILEAIALGCICISSNRCGATDIVLKNNAGFAYSNDENNLSEIVNYIESLANCENKNICCVQYDNLKTEYSWKGISKKYIDMVKYD